MSGAVWPPPSIILTISHPARILIILTPCLTSDYLGRLGDAGQLENVESEESLWVWNYQQSHRCIVFQDNNTTELLPSVSLSQSHVRSVLINERRQGGQLWTNQLTVKSSRGRGLGSLEPEKLSLLGFFCLAGTFGVSTFVSQGPRDLLTSDQAANIYK